MILAWILACSEPPPPPMGVTRVRLYSSPDAQTWTAAQAPLAEKLASLGLSPGADGTLWVSALDHGGRASVWDPWFGSPEVGGLLYEAGVWTRTSWSVDDEEALAFIDPQWMNGELWYLARDGGHGDPALSQTPSRVRVAPPGRTVYEAPQIADPSPVVFQGQLSVFLTQGHNAVIQLQGEPLAQVQRLDGVTVPFATVVQGELWLLAQQLIEGRRQPVLARSTDGRRFSPFVAMIPGIGFDCTSPVLGQVEQGWVLLCVEEPPRPAP